MKKFRPSPLLFLTVCVILAVLLAYLTGFFPFLNRVELDTVDLRFRIRGNIQPGSEVVLAVVDEKSIAAEGKWIWPRSKMAELVSRVSEAGARVIAFDIGFLEKDAGDRAVIQTIEAIETRLRELGKDGEEIKEYLADLREKASLDKMLAEAVKNSSAKVVLGYFFHTFTEDNDHLTQETLDIHEKNIQMGVYSFQNPGIDLGLIPLIHGIYPQSNIPEISQSAEFAGYFNMAPDSDGGVRSIPTVIHFKDKLYAPLALMAAAAYLDSSLSVGLDDLGVHSISVGRISIPVNSEGKMAINYRGGERTFLHVPITDILSGKVSQETLKDKIVIVGVTAIGIYDLRVTPFESVFPGVEIHANVVDNILTQDFVQRPDWMFLWDIAAILISGLFLGITLPRLGVVYGTLITCILFFGYGGIGQHLFSNNGLIINLVYPMAVMLLVYMVVTAYQVLVESRQKRFIKDAFSRYVAPSVVKKLIESPENLRLGGEKRHITAFFSDIQGFTSIAESLAPEEVAEILNLLLTEMTDIIMRHEGMVDKFEGDAIIAIFGAPNFIENQAQKACEASIEMQKRMAELRQMWREKGRPELRMRIGMCTGQAIVGNMGSKDRMDYTMIGDTVNTAARLEGMNKMYGLYTLISETTLEEVGEAIQAREIDLISVVGKQKPVKIYEILGYSGQVNDQTLQAAALYKKGLEAYRSRQWESAIEYFEKTIAIQPGDGPSLTMIARCREFIMTPPDQGWEGVFVAKTK